MLGNPAAAVSFKDLWTGVFALVADLLGNFQAQTVGEKTDEELVRDMQRGDDHAFEVLYERYFQKIYTFIVRRVGHKQTAEDIVSQVFVKAFTHRMSFIWKTSWSAWIYRIAANAITDHHRTKKPTVELDETKHDRPSSAPSAPDEVDRDLLRKKLETVIEKLNPRERLAITMKFYGECDNAEVAKALKVTANNVGVIVHRALKKCQTKV
jgi:RNA polymerase sigma-70 factor (ECF subfamily)